MNRIEMLRKAAGWTQVQLGKRIGVSRASISMYETETRQMDPPTIHALCDLFDCSADYLLCRSDTRLPLITDEEARLLEAYRAADPRDREFIDHLLQLDLPVKQKMGIS